MEESTVSGKDEKEKRKEGKTEESEEGKEDVSKWGITEEGWKKEKVKVKRGNG